MAVDPYWMRGPSDVLAVSKGCWFDAAAGEYVCGFLEKFCTLSQGRQWAGKKIKLLPWQRDFLMRLYGWKRADGRRRYTKAYLEVPKKNGKSALVSGLAIYHLVADGEDGAEVHLNAYDRAQAGIVFREASRMVRASRALRKRFGDIPKGGPILDERTNGCIRCNSADVASKDGLNSSFTLFDELHRQKTPDMWEIFEYAGVARDQPLILSITTAGEDLNSICYAEHDYAEKVNSGVNPDISFLGVIYAASPDEDIDDPATWRKANPSLGYTISEESFAEDLAKAKASQRKLNNFKRLRLNIWVKAEARFLKRADWQACEDKSLKLEDFRGRPCWAGLDMSSSTDLSAFVLIFREPSGVVTCFAWFWLPDGDLDAKERRDRVPYYQWAHDGFLTLSPGPVIEYDQVRDEILEILKDFELQVLNADPFGAIQLICQLRAAGMNVQPMRQGFLSQSGPTKLLEYLVLAKKFRHASNPLLDFCADNAVVRMDPAGGLKLDKNLSRLVIDGMAALVNGLGGMIGTEPEDVGDSVYEERDMLIL